MPSIEELYENLDAYERGELSGEELAAKYNVVDIVNARYQRAVRALDEASAYFTGAWLFGSVEAYERAKTRVASLNPKSETGTRPTVGAGGAMKGFNYYIVAYRERSVEEGRAPVIRQELSKVPIHADSDVEALELAKVAAQGMQDCPAEIHLLREIAVFDVVVSAQVVYEQRCDGFGASLDRS